MKKILLSMAAVSLMAAGANAQAIETSKFFDNMSLTIKGGATTPLKTPIENPRGMFGVELEKMITPVFGLGIEGEWTINTSSWVDQMPSRHAIDNQYVGIYGVTNLMNLFGGYKGSPRAFEVETVLGVGWGHSYASWQGGDENVVMTKAGLNLNYNFGDDKQWTIALKPAVVWNMSQVPQEGRTLANYNINRGALQLQAGVTYHFSGSKDSRCFVICDKKYTQRDIDNLNGTINALRDENQREKDLANKRINELLDANRELENALKKCQETKVEPVIKEDVMAFSPIQFKQGSATLINSDAAIKAMAEEMIKTGGNYKIVGYASTEGSEQLNQGLSQRRADVVANKLISYGVDPDKLTLNGAGSTSQYGSELGLNRVVVIYK